MNDFDRVAAILERYISPISARSVLNQALVENRVQRTTFKMKELGKIQESLERGLRLFASKDACALAIRDISELYTAKQETIESCSIEIKQEMDISQARAAARRMCELGKVNGFTLQKVTTIVSELARNIVSYTTGGSVELRWTTRPRRSITIRAVDTGPGIKGLDHILSGNYKSKTGLGRGLTGTRRLADQFDIETGPRGTTVTAEVYL